MGSRRAYQRSKRNQREISFNLEPSTQTSETGTMNSLDFVPQYSKRRSSPDVSGQIPRGHGFRPRASKKAISNLSSESLVRSNSYGDGIQEPDDRASNRRLRKPLFSCLAPMEPRSSSLSIPPNYMSSISPSHTPNRSPLSTRNSSLMQQLELSEENQMQHKFLGNTGLKVSNMCLGTMAFGTFPGGPSANTNEATSHKLLNKFVELGGNFIDTADTYPGMGTHSGYSEDIIGNWMTTQERHRLVIGTKCRYLTDPSCPNGLGLSRNHILWSLEQSLKRLKTDYIDLYQIHGWDAGTPLEDILRTLNDVVRSGKVRHIGASNLTGWQLQKFCDYAKFMGLEKMVTIQMHYNLLSRGIESEVVEVCKEEKIGILSWSPLKGGWLAGTLKREGDVPEGVDYDKTWKVIDAIDNIANTKGRSMAQVALRWLVQKDVVASVITGASSVEQLVDNMGAAKGWSLSDEEMAILDQASRPEMDYPYTMVRQQVGRARRLFNVI